LAERNSRTKSRSETASILFNITTLDQLMRKNVSIQGLKPIARQAQLHRLTSNIDNEERYLFLRGAVNPKASEVMNRSMGSPVPAKAQAPKGQKFILARQSTKRPASRSICKKTMSAVNKIDEFKKYSLNLDCLLHW